MKNKQKTIVIILGVLIVIIAGILGYRVAIAQNSKNDFVNGIVVSIKSNVDYQTKLIKSYEEYQKILTDNGVNISEQNSLKEEDFANNDFIVDYIPYDKKLKFTGDIGVDLLAGGVVITYPINHEVEENSELLLYFIPIEKGKIEEFNLANRIFEYEK